jgi:RNA polymerase sigma-70 factor (ECF subfamily)
MKTYADMVYRIALNYCKNKYDAEDITQEVFFKLVRVSDVPSAMEGITFNDEEHLKRWLIRVTINQCHSLFTTPWHKKTKYLVDEEL